jgi:hypothetical protein
MAIKYTVWLENRQNGHKICQRLPLEDPPKFTQTGIFGLKTHHLATPIQARSRPTSLDNIQIGFAKKLNEPFGCVETRAQKKQCTRVRVCNATMQLGLVVECSRVYCKKVSKGV